MVRGPSVTQSQGTVRTEDKSRHSASTHATHLVLGPTASCQRGSGFCGQALQSNSQEQMSPTSSACSVHISSKTHPFIHSSPALPALQERAGYNPYDDLHPDTAVRALPNISGGR
jgi:hypothetical protein